MSRAAYMREYRARKRGQALERPRLLPGYVVGTITPTDGAGHLSGSHGEVIAELTERTLALNTEVIAELTERTLALNTEVIAELTGRILALTEEVAELKRELAARPILPLGEAYPYVSTPYKVEFRPAPKPGKGKS